MNSRIQTILATLALAFVIGCDNDINVNAPFEETTVIYAALDGGTSVNYVRVTRAYLGEEGIYGGNDIGDSLYYDSLDVRLIGRNSSGIIAQEIIGVKDNSVTLDDGFFTADGYAAYRFNGNLNDEYRYQVKVTRPDGVVVSGRTDLVQPFNVTEPRYQSVNPAGVIAANPGQQVAWDEAVNGIVYTANFHMRYVEFPRNNKADSIRLTATYKFPYTQGQSLDGIHSISTRVLRDQFYGNLQNTIEPPTGNRIRICRRIDVEVVAGSDDLATHINVSQPSTGITQDQPFFTNVENGVGVVGSIRSGYKLNRQLTTTSLDELVFGDYTCELRFGKVTTTDTLFCQP